MDSSNFYNVLESGGTTSANSDNGVVGGNNSGADYGSPLTDNFYLNGSSNDGSNVVGAMSSFSFHSQK